MLTTQTMVVSLVGAAVVNAVVFGALGVMRHRRKKAYQGWAARHQMRYTRRDDDRTFIRRRGRVDPDRIEHNVDVLITVIERTPDTVGLG
jgi:hypothetical protein